MKRLPLLVDDNPSPLARAGMLLLVPIALTLLLPILLLVILALYLMAIFHGGRYLISFALGKRPSQEFTIRGPHFHDLPAAPPKITDESQSSP